MSFNRWGSIVDGVDQENSTETDIRQIRSDGVNILTTIPYSGVFRYEFEDDSDSTTAVDSWNDNNGTINGASYDSNASVGDQSLLFDGNDDYVSTPIQQDSEEVTPPVSFSIWYNLSSNTVSTAWGNSAGNGLYVSIARNSTDHLRFATYDGSYYGVSTTEAGAGDTDTWNHLVGTHDGSRYTLYLNGSEVASDSDSTWISTSTELLVGVRGNDYDARPFDGRLDDPRVYNKSLSSSEVSNLYNTGSIYG